MAGFLGVILFELADIFWIARLGTDAVAGIASAGFLIWAMYSIMSVTCYGCQTLIAQKRGAKQKHLAYEVIRQSIVLSLGISMGCVFILFWTAEPLFQWMGLHPKTFEAAMSYYLVFVIAFPLFYLDSLLAYVFYGFEDTKTSTIILVCVLCLNIILDPFFIFGWGPFPAWGPFGAAFSSFLCRLIGTVIRLYILKRKGYIDTFRLKKYFGTSYYKKILSIGIPTASVHLIWTLVYPLLTSLITKFGMAPLAGMTIGHRIESFAYFTAAGFSAAIQTLVGHEVGKKNITRAKVLTYQGRRLITYILIPASLLFIFLPEFLISLISNDPEVITEGAKYLRTIGYLEILLGWEMVFEGGFNGLGNTRPYMYISVPLTLGRYPAAYILVEYFGMGIEAIWWAISISTALKGLLMNLWFRYTKVK